MILGTGIDIIEVSRIRASYEKFGERFLKRILRPEEIAYCLSHRFPAPFLAARFAAKEAISKAFGTGIGKQLGWQDLEVGRKESKTFRAARRREISPQSQPHGELRDGGGDSGRRTIV